MRYIKVCLLACLISMIPILWSVSTHLCATAQQPKSKDYPLKQAQRELSMLDDIYKSSIVLITTHYVDGKESLAAGAAFRKLFEMVQTKGWHEVRLLDGTGDPYNSENSPKVGFETVAIKRIVEGENRVEEVVNESGKRFLLGATAIPVVMDKCIICHDAYANLPKGKAIGALSYKIPLQELE